MDYGFVVTTELLTAITQRHDHLAGMAYDFGVPDIDLICANMESVQAMSSAMACYLL